MFCKYCGSSNNDDAVQCTHCSSILKSQTGETPLTSPSFPTVTNNFPDTNFQTQQYQQNSPSFSAPSLYTHQTMPDSTVTLKPYRKVLPAIACILSLLTVNLIALVLSVIAVMQSGKYKKAAAYGRNADANSAVHISKVLSIIAVILSVLTVISAAVAIPYAIRYTNLGLYF